MTPQEILALSEPLEAVYTDVTTQLIENMCKHLGTGKELALQEWQIKKLAELNKLTDESVNILAAMTGRKNEEIRKAIAGALSIEVKDVEKVLSGAVKAGVLTDIGISVEQSEGLRALMEGLVNQAEDKTNLVNTTMLNSTRERYLWAVNNTVNEERLFIEKNLGATDIAGVNAQLGKAQEKLNTAAGTVMSGAEARTQALSRTVRQLANEGITGFIDSAGRKWSPEGYVNMEIRTTVHNAAIEAQKTRAGEYGIDTFQISTHAGARPRCAPYQGWICSWSGGGFEIEDLHGNTYPVHDINETSYGEAAGIFGINCGHRPETFVPGYSIPRYEPTKNEAENEREYKESQEQRYLERKVRSAKQEAIAQDAAGNTEAFNKAAQKVKKTTAEYKEYCREKGRTPRNDRLQVYSSPSGKEYKGSVSSKVTWANKKNEKGAKK